jgi:hypothetical protein
VRAFISAAVSLLVALACGASGDEHSFGVSRTAELLEFPDPACVREVITGIEGVSSYDEWYWPKTNSDPQAVARSRRAHHFAYDGSALRVELGIFEDAPDKVRWVQAYIQRETPPPQQSIDEARRLMLAVEVGVEARCGVVDLTKRSREACSGVECR